MNENGISIKRGNLEVGLSKALAGIPVKVKGEDNSVHIMFQDLLICGVTIGEETYKIYDISPEWANITKYRCEVDNDGTQFYYLDTGDECIAECQRLVIFEAQKGNRQLGSRRQHNSELSRILDLKRFEEVFKDFLKHADENAVSGRGRGGHIPYGFSKKPMCDGGDLSTHYGQGGASKSPYLNWWVVSIYYLPVSGNIVVGIEADRKYPYLKSMTIKPIRYSIIGNRSEDTAIFYSTTKSDIDYEKLYEAFLNVCEEVMRLGLQ